MDWKEKWGDIDLWQSLGRLSNKTELFCTQALSIQLRNPSTTFPLEEMRLLPGRGISLLSS